MFTPIHRALGLEAGSLTFDLIEKAVQFAVEETGDLDWKKRTYDSRNPKWDEEAAKDIAAMANSGGGWIVFGVMEDGNRNVASQITPIEWSADEHQRILKTAYAKVSPPVIGLEFFEIPCDQNDDARSVVMMRVPDSREAPHFARKGDVAFVAPRRNGPHTVYMNDREIERGFRERFQFAEDQEKLLQDRFELACMSLRPEGGVFLAFAALPFEPVTSRKPANKSDVLQNAEQALTPGLLQRAQEKSMWNLGEVKKGLRQWVVRNVAGTSASYRKFLYDDATVLGAYQLGLLSEIDMHSAYYPVGRVNHCMSEHVENAVIDFVTLLRNHSRERQANSGFRIRAGLVGMPDEPIYIRTTEGATNLLLDEKYMMPIFRFQPVTTDLTPLTDLRDLLPAVYDLTQDLVNQGGVQRLKVIAEPED